MLTNLVRVTEDSVLVSNNTSVRYPNGEVKTLEEAGDFAGALATSKNRRVYCEKNGVIAIIFEDSFLVTPYTKQKVECLEKDGNFEKAEFFVPFSDGGIPELRKNFWKKLLEDVSYYNNKPQVAEPLA